MGRRLESCRAHHALRIEVRRPCFLGLARLISLGRQSEVLQCSRFGPKEAIARYWPLISTSLGC